MSNQVYIDIFNGDADGILSLVQWRKANPVAKDKQVLVTGVKRDISLVKQVDTKMAQDAVLTVLDVSFDKNAEAVEQILPFCDSLFYCDHHKADKLFDHPKLTTKIDTVPTVCTALLVNDRLDDAYASWAVAAAFGDGLDGVANEQVNRLGFSEAQRDQLKEFGVLVNYNGYGSAVSDLHFAPDELYLKLMNYASPFEVIDDASSPFATLQAGYKNDMQHAQNAEVIEQGQVRAVILEDADWARRISGTYGNQLAAQHPEQAIVVATINDKGSYTISLRAPKSNPFGASTICSQFATGGGREGAAGVNELPITELGKFIKTVQNHYQA